MRKSVWEGIVRPQTNSLGGFFDCSLILSNDRQHCSPQVDVGEVRARISLNPKIAGFYGLWDVSGDSFLVGGGNPIPLRITGPVAQFICLCTVVNREAGFKSAGCQDAQVCVSHRKVRVEFDGP